MGQRLVISIYDNKSKEKIANSYYHWDGFIEKAVEYLQKIDTAIEVLNKENSKNKENNSWNNEKMRKLIAVRLLQEATKTTIVRTTKEDMEVNDRWADETLDIYIDFDEEEMYLKEYKVSSMPLLSATNKIIAHLFESAIAGKWIEEE